MPSTQVPLRVLIVDDDITILSLLEEVFSVDASLAVTTMSDSQQAYEHLERESYDLIISDLMMPKIDGLTLLRRARALNPSVLVVIITGYASLETTLKAIHAGVYDYITKPFRIEEFRLLVHNAAARLQLVRQNERLQKENQQLREQISQLQVPQDPKIKEPVEAAVASSGRTTLRPNGSGESPRPARASYEKVSETVDERYDREIRHLEELYASGGLSYEEFEQAKQRLRTLI